jgi:superfamily II DNA/RNA helicase
VERAAEDATRPKPPRREQTADAGPRDHDAKNTTKKITQVLDIHGRQKQQKRTSTFFEFCRATSGVLLCTDVAARGLDIPEVNWIVQFDPPA